MLRLGCVSVVLVFLAASLAHSQEKLKSAAEILAIYRRMLDSTTVTYEAAGTGAYCALRSWPWAFEKQQRINNNWEKAIGVMASLTYERDKFIYEATCLLVSSRKRVASFNDDLLTRGTKYGACQDLLASGFLDRIDALWVP